MYKKHALSFNLQSNYITSILFWDWQLLIVNFCSREIQTCDLSPPSLLPSPLVFVNFYFLIFNIMAIMSKW